MAINIDAGKLLSLAMRKEVAGSDLLRVIEFGIGVIDTDPDDNGGGGSGGLDGIKNTITRWVKKAIGWISGKLIEFGKGLLKRAWTVLTEGFWNLVDFIWNFDWNASDAELDAKIKQLNTQSMGEIGGLLGRLGGSVVCVGLWGVAAVSMPMIGGKAIASAALSGALPELLEELGEDAWSRIGNLLRQRASVGALLAYKYARRGIKNPLMRQLIKDRFGDAAAARFDRWGHPDGDEWSFQKYQSDAIENIKDPGWENFWEEFTDEAGDACREATLLLADRADNARSELDKLEERLQGKNVAAFVYPDKENRHEKYLYYGKEVPMMQTICSDLAMFQYLRNRDIGHFAQSNDIAPITFSQERRLKILLTNRTSPPFYKSAKAPDFVRWECQIPFPLAGLTRTNIESAFKNAQYGAYYVTATGFKGRGFFAHGNTEENALATLKEMEDLSEDYLSEETIRVHKKGDIGGRIAYAGSMYVWKIEATRTREVSGAKGRVTRDGKRLESQSVTIGFTGSDVLAGRTLYDPSLYDSWGDETDG